MSGVFITGGCGFVGSNLAMALLQRGTPVTAFDNLSRRGSEYLCERVQQHGASFIRGDIRNPEQLAGVTGDFDLMIECSAEPSVLVGTDGADAHFMVDNNLVGALNCFEWARKRAVPVIFLSSSRVYPYGRINAQVYTETETRYQPVEESPGFSARGISPLFPMDGARSLYGATKWAAEIVLQEYARQYDLPAVINRCGVIAGPWQLGKVDQGVFTHWLVCHMAKRPLSYIGFGGQGKQVRDLLHIDDLVDLLLIQMARIEEYRGALFQAGGSDFASLSLRETTALCQQITGHTLHIGSDPVDRAADVRWLLMDSVGTESEFGWTPKRSAEQILVDTHEWLRSNPHLLQLLGGVS